MLRRIFLEMIWGAQQTQFRFTDVTSCWPVIIRDSNVIFSFEIGL